MSWSTDANARARHFFAEDFDAPPPTPRSAQPDTPPAAPARYTEADLAASRQAAWDAGHAAGGQAARADREGALHDMLARIAAEAREARAALLAQGEAVAEELARTLLAALGHVLPELCARHGAAEIAAVVRDLRPSLLREPQLRIQVPPHSLDTVRQALAAHHADVADDIHVTSSNRLGPSDIRLHWHLGESARSADALWREVLAALDPLGLAPDHPIGHPAPKEPAHAE